MAETTTTGKVSAGSGYVREIICATRRIRSPLPTEVPPNFNTCICDFISPPKNMLGTPGLSPMYSAVAVHRSALPRMVSRPYEHYLKVILFVTRLLALQLQ